MVFFKLIAEVGFPIAAAIGAGYFVFLTLKFILAGVTGSVNSMKGIIGAPIDDAQHAKNAVKTALEMIAAVEQFNETLAEEGKPPVGMGAGVYTGETLIGNIGSKERFGYDVLGDTVSMAARLEGQSKPYGVKLVIGPKTTEYVRDEYTVVELDNIAVKGKSEGVKIYSIVDGYDSKLHQLYLDAYYKGDWKKALKLLIDCKNNSPELKKYYEAMEERLNEGKPNNWDGTFRATSK